MTRVKKKAPHRFGAVLPIPGRNSLFNQDGLTYISGKCLLFPIRPSGTYKFPEGNSYYHLFLLAAFAAITFLAHVHNLLLFYLYFTDTLD